MEPCWEEDSSSNINKPWQLIEPYPVVVENAEFWISARIQFSSMPVELRCPNIPSNKMSTHLQISLSDAMFILKSNALKGAKILHMTRIVSHVETVPVAGAIPGRSKRRHPRPSRERAPRSTTAKKLFRKSCPSWEHPFPPSQVIFFGMVPSNHIYFEKKTTHEMFPPSPPLKTKTSPLRMLGPQPTQPLVAGRLFREAQGVGKLGKHQGWDSQGN